MAAFGTDFGDSREENPGAVAVVGLVVVEDDLSALDLSCSDHFKPSPDR